MRIYAKHLKYRARIVDIDTGSSVRGVIWVDEEAGTAEAYRLCADGTRKEVKASDGTTRHEICLLKGKFRLVPITTEDLVNPKHDFSKMIGAPACARCKSPLTARGNDLCPRCLAKDRGKPYTVERCGPFEFHKCQRCSRDATWSVVDHVEVTPQQGVITTARKIANGQYLFGRSQAVGRRHFCSWCFQGPRLLDHKGEVIRTEDTGIRPDK